MSRTTIGIAAAAVLIAGLAIGSAMMFSGGSAPPPARKSLPVKTGADQGPQTPSPAAFPLPPALPSPEQPPAAVAKAPPAAKKTDLPAAAKQPPAPQRTGGKPPALFPDAREALSEVGVNPEAEAIWLAAIADPNCPAEDPVAAGDRGGRGVGVVVVVDLAGLAAQASLAEVPRRTAA
jgi:hypothetical protein